eukprot:328634_1
MSVSQTAAAFGFTKPWDQYSHNELIEFCEDEGLKTTGSNSALSKRLRYYYQSEYRKQKKGASKQQEIEDASKQQESDAASKQQESQNDFNVSESGNDVHSMSDTNALQLHEIQTSEEEEDDDDNLIPQQDDEIPQQDEINDDQMTDEINDEIEDFVAKNGFKSFHKTLIDNKFDSMIALHELSCEDLKELGMKQMGQRKKFVGILKEIKGKQVVGNNNKNKKPTTEESKVDMNELDDEYKCEIVNRMLTFGVKDGITKIDSQVMIQGMANVTKKSRYNRVKMGKTLVGKGKKGKGAKVEVQWVVDNVVGPGCVLPLVTVEEQAVKQTKRSKTKKSGGMKQSGGTKEKQFVYDRLSPVSVYKAMSGAAQKKMKKSAKRWNVDMKNICLAHKELDEAETLGIINW